MKKENLTGVHPSSMQVSNWTPSAGEGPEIWGVEGKRTLPGGQTAAQPSLIIWGGHFTEVNYENPWKEFFRLREAPSLL